MFDYFKIENNKVLKIKTTLKNYINNKIHLKFKELWRILFLMTTGRDLVTPNYVHIDSSKINLFKKII